jgi:UDPglucose 6-dehydrogenase
MTIAIVGLGFVGSAMMNSFKIKNINLILYDKFKPCTHELRDVLKSDICFLTLPTPYNSDTSSYNTQAIEETCSVLCENKYTGAVVIKSTVTPGTCQKISENYTSLNIIHNPEFLTARTANDDYHNQKHIVLGKTKNCRVGIFNNVVDFHSKHYPWAHITTCKSVESETAKLVANNFYSVKVQFFTEIYLLCEKINCDYNVAKQILIRNNWVNPMHTAVPGPDGQISYGGLCFPKDTNALNEFMKRKETPSSIINACINERNTMRDDHDNCQ